MLTRDELLAVVEEEFALTGRGFRTWPNPHAGRLPREEEYSRVTDPGKWRIVGARAEAWLRALVRTGLADVERDAELTWRAEPAPLVARADVAVPRAGGALAMVLARSRIGGLDGAGVLLGVDRPTVLVTLIPDCGCDACDSGSALELENLDTHLMGIVSGEFRRLSDGDRVITVFHNGSLATTGHLEDPRAVLADPRGWDELAGSSWFDPS